MRAKIGILRRKVLLCCSLFSGLAIAVVGCSGSDEGENARDGAPGADRSRPPDSALPGDDGGGGDDAALPACTTASLAPLALDDAYCVTAKVGLPAVPAGIALRGDTLWSFVASGAKSFEVKRWSIDRATSTLTQPAGVLSFTAKQDGDLFPSEYLALHGKAVAVGYNNSDFSNPQGTVLWGGESSTPEEVAAGGNYDAVFFDSKTLLVNGLSVGDMQGQAVYALRKGQAPRRLITDLGEASAPLVLGAQVLFAGGFAFAEGKTKIFGFSRAAVAAALDDGSELSATGDGTLIAEGGYLDAAALGDDLVLISYDEQFEYDGVSRIPVSVDASPQPPRPVVAAATAGSGAVKRLAADGPLLGLVFEDAAGDAHLAIVREAGASQ